MNRFISIIGFTLVASFYSVSSLAAPGSCKLAALGFGQSATQIISKYNLTGHLALKSDHHMLNVRGAEMCSNLPAKTRINLLFLKNKLVQATMSFTGNDIDLFNAGLAHFGDASKTPNLGGMETGKSFQSFWADDNKHIVAYNLKRNNTGYIERLEINSIAHQELFNSLYKDEESPKQFIPR